MKKLYLTEMETEKRNYIIKLNKKLINKLQEDLYSDNMDLQAIELRNILGDKALQAIEYHDNYTSFFYTLKDWRKFITDIDYMYLTDETNKLIDEIDKGIEQLDNIDNVIRLDVSYIETFI